MRTDFKGVGTGRPPIPNAGSRTAMPAEGISWIGEQREIFRSGRADASVALADLQGMTDLYALGPCAGLDGEITVFNSVPYISRLRGGGNAYTVDCTYDHQAIFLVWTRRREWDNVVVPDTVASYGELEIFVAEAARRTGVNIATPFPFLMRGTPRELVWHINVDRTDGQPITPELFWKSKQQYALDGERVDIFGVYSGQHSGIFIGQGLKIHAHVVSRDSPATGHIDAIVPGSMMLRLPRP